MCSLVLGQKIHYLDEFLNKGDTLNWEYIKQAVTASALCEEKDPIDKAFKVH